MEKKTFKFDIKELSEAGEFEGYASIYGIVDLQNEVVDRGAFTRTLQHKKGKVFLLDGHDPDKRIGVVYLEDTPIGLKAKGVLNLAKESAREIYEDIKFYLSHSLPLGMSIGFKTIKDSWEGITRHLKEINLYEVSTCTFPALEPALIESAKENDEFLIPEGKPAGGRGWDETDSSWRYRLKSPSLFIDDSFRSKEIDDGVVLVMGKLKSEGREGSMTAQSVVFDKDKFPEKSDAQEWLKDHEDVTKKSTDFNENFIEEQESRELQSRINSINMAFERAVYEVLYSERNLDVDIQEKIALISKALDDFKAAYLTWATDLLNYYSSKSINPQEIKSGRMFSSANLNQMKEVIKLLTALIEKAEPSDSGDTHSDEDDDSADTKSDPETSLVTALDSLDLEIKQLLRGE